MEGIALLEMLPPSSGLHLQAGQRGLPALWVLYGAGRAGPAFNKAVLCRLPKVVPNRADTAPVLQEAPHETGLGDDSL